MIDDEYFDIVSNNDKQKSVADQNMSVTAEDTSLDNAVHVTDTSGKQKGVHSHHDSHHGHHSSHHGHHSSHHGHNHTHSRRHKNKITRFLKKHRKMLINLSVVAAMIVFFMCIIYWNENAHKDNELPVQSVSNVAGYIQIETSLYPKDVSIANAALEEYMSSDKAARSIYNEYKGHLDRMDTAKSVRFSFDIKGIPEGVSVVSARFEISTSSYYTDSRIINVAKDAQFVDIYFLESDAQYYYRLELTLSDGSVTGSCGSFKTADSPRFMNVDGAYNMRDIGGWTTVSGKDIKQGLLYRGTEIDGAIESKYCLTAEGIVQMTSDLKIKTDMDLREKSATPGGRDVLGVGVQHNYYGAPMYKAIFDEPNYARMRKIFSDLADESNYPIYLHCTYGLDRTGTVCYILEALLGLSDADLRREYEISAFNNGIIDLESFAGLATLLSVYDGDTTQEKAENYLLSIGVTADEIANIRRIFLGE